MFPFLSTFAIWLLLSQRLQFLLCPVQQRGSPAKLTIPPDHLLHRHIPLPSHGLPPQIRGPLPLSKLIPVDGPRPPQHRPGDRLQPHPRFSKPSPPPHHIVRGPKGVLPPPPPQPGVQAKAVPRTQSPLSHGL